MPATLILNYLMSHYSRKKNIKNFGVLCCPPLLPTPLPWKTLSFWPPPPFTFPFRTFHLRYYYPHPIVSIMYYIPPLHIHTYCQLVMSFCLILSCHCVMSICHVILSYIYTYQLQTKYDYNWIIYM